MAVCYFTHAGFVNGRYGLERPHGFDKTPLEVGRKQIVLTHAARRGGVDKYDLVPPADVGDNACVRYVAFLARLRDKKQPVTGLDIGHAAYFLTEFGLLPGNAWDFDAHFGIHLANEAGAVDTLFIIPAGAVRSACIGSGDLHNLGYVCRIGVAGARVRRGGASGCWLTVRRSAVRRSAVRRSACGGLRHGPAGRRSACRCPAR